MPLILRPGRLAWKPVSGTAQLDAAHPLAVGIEAVYLLSDQSGQMLDLGPHRRHGTLVSATRTAKGGPHSQCIDVGTGGEAKYVDAGTWSVPSSYLTLMVWAFDRGFDAGRDDRYLSKADGTSANQHDWMLGKTDSSGAKQRCRINRSINTHIGGITIPTSQWNQHAMTWQPNGADSISALFLNGVPDTPSTGTALHGAGPLATNTNAVYIGNQPTSTGNAPNAIISMALVWRRALTVDEIAWLYHQPFDILKPRVHRRYWDVPAAAGGGGGDAVPQCWASYRRRRAA